MKSTNRKWLLIAAGMLMAGAWLMTIDESEPVAKRKKFMAFPTALRETERTRLQKRQRPRQTPPPAPGASAAPVEPTDPVLRAMGIASPGDTLMVLEANALRHSFLGQSIINCMNEKGQKRIDQFKEKSGIDLLENLDRVAMGDSGMILSGHFQDAKLSELFGDVSNNYGDQGIIFEKGRGNDDSQEGPAVFIGSWNQEMLMIGYSEEDIQKQIDIIEGRRTMETTPISESQTYGEAYGTLSADFVAKLLPPEMEDMADQIRQAVDKVNVHADAFEDIAISANFGGSESGTETNELARSLGGALSLALSAARIGGDEKLASLLEYARVVEDGEQFRLELALPQSVLQSHLDAICKDVGPNRPSETP